MLSNIENHFILVQWKPKLV